MMPAQRNVKNRSRQICGIVFKLEFGHIVCEFDRKTIKLTLFQVAIKSSNGGIRFWNNHCELFRLFHIAACENVLGCYFDRVLVIPL